MDTRHHPHPAPVLIIGAGPAGLTAAYDLTKRGVPFILVEKDSVVGGIARTVRYKGYRFDIGGHRFFTKVSRVHDLWKEILGDDFLKRPRLSHIYYKRKFFLYPIKPVDVVKKLGFFESAFAGLSYFKAKLFPRKREISFEDYIVNHFGWRLYKTFFKSYTEKVWGIPTTEIKAAWAAQRIKGLSFTSIIKTAFFGNRKGSIASLIEEFYYPKYGPGMMWEKTLERIEASGVGEVHLTSQPLKLYHKGGRITEALLNIQGVERRVLVSNVISSMPIGELFRLMEPRLSVDSQAAADSLNYRDFITVALVLNKKDLFPDNWIYIHDPSVLVGRIQNFNNWSPYLVPNTETTCLGLEYFCFTSDDIWKKTDAELITLASEEIEKVGLAGRRDIIDGAVVRMEKTYPIYDDAYEKAMPTIKETFTRFGNLYPVGRNGMHRYNNQDHAMYTAMLAVENIADGARHNLWDVNVEMVYHEEVGNREKGNV